MADLDDFFAKKDKKKSKTKKGGGILQASGSEQESPAVAQPVKKPEKKKEGESESTKKPSEEEEWADFQEEREKDYTGLKIQKLQIQDTEDNASQASEEQEFNEEGEVIKREPVGPWNKQGQTTGAVITTPVPVKEVEVVPALPNTAGGVYVPPSRRGVQPTETSSTRSKVGRKNAVPDINKEELFPTLSAAIAIDQAAPKTKKQLEQSTIGFTEAKHSRSHSSRGAAGGAEEGPRLNLGNKFGALSENS